jgi:DNA-binding SARP family transcriptional activator
LPSHGFDYIISQFAQSQSEQATIEGQLSPSPDVQARDEGSLVKIELISPSLRGPPEKQLRREGLLDGLDQACRSSRVVWLGAQAGAGKSILARQLAQRRGQRALYLLAQPDDGDARRFFLDLRRALAMLCKMRLLQLPMPPDGRLDLWGVYAQQLFESVSGHWPEQALIILDDARRIAQTPQFADVVEFGLLRLPADCNVLVLSRGAIPSSLVSAIDSGLIHRFDARALLLDTPEIAALAHLRGRAGLSASDCANIHAMTNGWFAGVNLLMQYPRFHSGELPVAALDVYFSEQVLPDLSASDIEQFCLLAFFPSFSPSSISSLFGRDDLAFALDQPAELTSFVVPIKSAAYRFHPQFQKFLQVHARRIFGPDAVQNLLRRTCEVLWFQGEENAAAALLREHGLWSDLVRYLPTRFPDLVCSEQSGRLRGWMREPHKRFGQSAPWAACWDALALVGKNPALASSRLEGVLAAFNEEGDALGAICALTGIVECVINQWGDFHPLDHWIPALDQQLSATRDLPEDVSQRAQTALFVAMMYRQPDHPGLPRLLGRMQRIAEGSEQDSLRAQAGSQLLFYQCWWRGDMAAAQLMFDLSQGMMSADHAVPAVHIAWHAVQSVYRSLMRLDMPGATELAERGLELAERANLHAWDTLLLGQSLWCSLTAEEGPDAVRANAARLSRSLRPDRPLDHSYYHFLKSIQSLHEGAADAMRAHAQAALRCAREAGVPWAEGKVLCAVARAQALQGDASAARITLDRAEQIALRIASDSIRFDVLLARLEHNLCVQDEVEALSAWMKLWRRCGFANFPWWRGQTVRSLCARALALDVEATFTQERIRTLKLAPPADQVAPESWHMPVRIQVFGTFVLEVEGQRIAASGKAPKRPLLLLKTLVASGGQVGRGALAQRLWPHLDAEAAEQVLKVTLHRLRKLVGAQSIQCEGGKLCLDAGRCHVDLFAFTRRLDECEADARPQWGVLRELLQQFSAGLFTEDAQWAAELRMQLLARLQSCLHACIVHAITEAHWTELADCCRQGLALDPKDEVCHLGLIESCLELGRSSDAQLAYAQCAAQLPRDRIAGLGKAFHARLHLHAPKPPH